MIIETIASVVMLPECHAYYVMWMEPKLEEWLRIRLHGCNYSCYSIKYLDLFPYAYIDMWCLYVWMHLIPFTYNQQSFCFYWFFVFYWCLQVLFKCVKYRKERHHRYKGDKRKAKVKVGPLILFVLSIVYRKRLKWFKLLF